MTLKIAGWVTLALVVTFGVGWYVGASGSAAPSSARRGRARIFRRRARSCSRMRASVSVEFRSANRRSTRRTIVLAQTRLRQVVSRESRARGRDRAVAEARLVAGADAAAQTSRTMPCAIDFVAVRASSARGNADDATVLIDD